MTRLTAPRVAIAIAIWAAVSSTAIAQTARERFEAASERDRQVRALLANPAESGAPADLTRQIAQVLASFEAIVRRFPASGYADNALWQAATLAQVSYERLRRPEDSDRALKMYRWLVQEYPSSSFVKRANEQIDAMAPVQTPAAAPAAAPAPSSSIERATLTTIQRTILADTVRITLELDREVAYLEERLSRPARVYFDLRDVAVTPELKDVVLTYPTDVVSKIRVGRHPDNTVRVVLDLESVSRYSVFTLYSPFRLVIDAERTAPGSASATVPARMAMLPARPMKSVSESPRAAVRREPPLVTDTESATPLSPAPAPAPVASTPAVTPPPPVPPAAPSPTTPSTNGAGGFSLSRQLGLGVSRIVIDPGHGGHDPGVLGKGLTEAALVLDVALRLEKLLLKEPGLDVVLTRRTDVYVQLEERTAIANRQSADLFLSIHANASRNDSAKGIESYFLSFASSPEAEAVAARENSASTREMHQLPDIIKAIALNNKLDESRDLAAMVQDSLVSHLRRANREVRSRGVKKAPFVVLIGASMPSVLTEISFLSNRQELSLLKTSAYKQRIAESLFNAVMKYRKALKGAASTATQER